MKKFLVLLILASLVGCNRTEKENEKDETLSDYFDKQEEIILQAEKSAKREKLLSDFYVGMSRRQFDSIVNLSIERNLMRIKNDTTLNLIIPNLKGDGTQDYFVLEPIFKNDSLQATKSYINLGYYPYDSDNYYFKEYALMLTNKYGGPKGIYSDHKPIDTENRMSRFKYHFWIKDNLFIEIHQSSFPNKNKEKEERYLTIYFGSLEYMKNRIEISRKKEEMQLSQSIDEENKKRAVARTTDSLRTEIF